MTRAFRLRNASGDMIDLLADLDIFGVNPEGLGVSFDHTSHLSNSNYLLEKSELNQNEFKLSVALGYLSHDPYNAYYRLVQFLDKAPYILEYETTAGTWQREVRLKELSKTEIVSGDIMLEDFTLACFSPWYRNVESKYDPTEDTPGDGKIYIEYKSTALLKKIYAFSYSADGTDGFTTDYPQDNMVSSIYPFDTKKRFSFKTNDTTNSKYTITSDKLSLTAVASDRWAQLVLSSIVDGAALATPELATIAVGEVYTMSGKFTPTSDINSNMVINIVMSYINQAGTRVSLSGKNVRAPELQKGVPYYYYDTTKVIPGDIATARSVVMSVTFQGTGTVEIESVKLEPGDKVTGNKGNPTYIGEREVPQDYPTNINIVRRDDIKPFTGDPTIDKSKWVGNGEIIFKKKAHLRSGMTMYNRSLLKGDTEYNLHMEFQAPSTGLRNFLVYNIYDDTIPNKVVLDGEIITDGFSKIIDGAHWLVDKNNPNDKDTHMHILDVTFTTPTNPIPSNSYDSLIFQPNVELSDSTTLNIYHIMLTEGPYPGYYTQEELPQFYQWSPISGKWTPPTPDGRDYNLTYDNVVFDYDYYQSPATRGPGMHAYKYDYIYEGWANGANGVFRVENNSIYMGTQEGSPVEIYIDGPANNPYWEVVRDGVILASDGFNLTIGEGYRLVVSSVPGEQRAELIAPDGTKSNVYQQQRLDLSNFVKIPTGYSQVIFHNAKYVSFNMREEKVVV